MCYIALPSHLAWSIHLECLIFGDQTISIIFLVVEQTGRISLASFSDSQSYASDHSCCLSAVVSMTFLT